MKPVDVKDDIYTDSIKDVNYKDSKINLVRISC